MCGWKGGQRYQLGACVLWNMRGAGHPLLSVGGCGQQGRANMPAAACTLALYRTCGLLLSLPMLTPPSGGGCPSPRVMHAGSLSADPVLAAVAEVRGPAGSAGQLWLPCSFWPPTHPPTLDGTRLGQPASYRTPPPTNCPNYHTVNHPQPYQPYRPTLAAAPQTAPAASSMCPVQPTSLATSTLMTCSRRRPTTHGGPMGR